MSRPSWLPDLIPIGTDPEEFIARLYQVFSRDFKRDGCALRGMPVWWDAQFPPGDIFEQGFWHLVSCANKKTKQRELDYRRAQRLSWCSPTIKNADDPAVTAWDYREGSKRVRTYLWLRDYDYVVILEKRQVWLGMVAFIVTAYVVGGRATRDKLRKRYNKRIPDVQPPPF